jgi:hypothetical protein
VDGMKYFNPLFPEHFLFYGEMRDAGIFFSVIIFLKMEIGGENWRVVWTFAWQNL